MKTESYSAICQQANGHRQIRPYTRCIAIAFYLLLSLAISLLGSDCLAERFDFGSDVNGITGLTTATLNGSEFAMQLTAGPTDSLFFDVDAQGLGIDSLGLPGVVDSDRSKFNTLLASSSNEGTSTESLHFTFDRPGRITGFDFDGVKDELFEYFRFDSPGAVPTYFFDSMADPAGINVNGNVIFLLEGGALDDEIYGLSFPFAAGDELTLTYGQLGDGNGSRLEGIVVEVPEPTWSLGWLIATPLTLRKRNRAASQHKCEGF